VLAGSAIWLAASRIGHPASDSLQEITEDVMSDQHIQTHPSSNAADPMVDQLLRRVQVLEDDKKRWKTIALVCLFLLLLVVVGGGLMTAGLGSVYLHYVQREEMQIREMERAQQQAEMVRLQAEAQRAATEAAERERQRPK